MANNYNRNRRNRQKKEDNYIPPFGADILAREVEVFSLSEDTYQKLQKGNVKTLLDVAKRREKDFYKIPTFNKKNLFELKGKVKEAGIEFRPEEPAAQEIRPISSANGGANNNSSEKQSGSANSGRGAQNSRLEARPQRNNGENSARNSAQNGGNQPIQKVPDASQRNRQPGARGERNSDPQSRNSRDFRNAPQQRTNIQGKDRNNQNPNQTRGRDTARDNKSRPVKENGRYDLSVSEKRTKDERDKKRPQRQSVNIPQDIYVKINKNGKWGFQDRSGKVVVPPIYDEVFYFKDEVCCVEQNELFGFIDRKGEEIVPIIYECAASFSEGYAAVFKGGYCGYINKENDVIIDFKFDAGTAVIDGNCRVKKDGKWGELHLDKPNEIRWIN